MDQLLEYFIDFFQIEVAPPTAMRFEQLWAIWLQIWDGLVWFSQILQVRFTIPIVGWEIYYGEIIFGAGLIALILLGAIKFIIDTVT